MAHGSGGTPPDGREKEGFAPVAIIGLGCRFPKAADVGAYWRMMLEGVDGIIEIPSSRWDVDMFYDPRPATPCKMVTRSGGFLDEIDRFDPYFFGISPREAIRVDPQQRLLLEVTWEAMERAGIPRERFTGTRTGVFVGVCSDDYITLERSDVRNIDIYLGTGGSRGSAAGRLAFVYGLNGPVAAVDTACSSSLVAVHQACNSLQQGDCDMALAGGVNVVLQPGTAIAFSQANMLSPDGRCKAFDARANGFVRSEGAGIVLLKPLARALEDGDPVYAVIRASASNNDGSSSPFMTPSRDGQAALLSHAYQRAGVRPDTVQYVEAHGTGTAVGDPVEVGALADVLGEGRAADQRCVLGSVKTNIGHTEAAAGVAGLIKAVLCLQHKTIPPNLHFLTPNPNISWEELPFRVPTAVTPWPEHAGPARAGVNSFGISGTNAHVVLEEAPPPCRVAPEREPAGTAEILVVSAHTPDALAATAASYRDLMGEGESSAGLRDLCYSAAMRRTQHEQRLGVVGRSREEMKQKLDAYLNGEMVPGVVRGAVSAEALQPPVFVFSGIGTQWPEMGRQLSGAEPVFRRAMEQCDSAVRAVVGWSVLEEIDRPAENSRLDRIDLMQPAIFSVQVGLAALWRSWGVEPCATMGHSMGEIAAAHVAGALSLEDAARIVCARSGLMHRVSGLGRMAAVGLTPEQTLARMGPWEGRISLAAVNGPSSCAVSGDAAAVEAMVRSLEGEGIFCRLLKVDVACHSHQMEPLRADLATALAGITPHAAALPLYSTVLGRSVSGAELDPEYWARNLRQPVQFAGTVDAALSDGRRVFLEVSPNPALVTPIRQMAQHRNKTVVAAASLRAGEDEREALLESAGLLFVNGLRLDWTHWYPAGTFVAPPPYAWQRERFWFAEGSGLSALLRTASDGLDLRRHPLLSRRWEPADDPGTHWFEAEIDMRSLSWLQDHRVEGAPLLPFTAYFEMALAASIELVGPGPRTIRDVRLTEALFLSSERPSRLQLRVRSGSKASNPGVSAPAAKPSGSMSFQFFAHIGGGGDHDAWTPLASGHIDMTPKEALPPAPPVPDLSPGHLDQAYPVHRTGEQFYDGIVTGMEFGPLFRGVQQAWGLENSMVTRVALPPAIRPEAKSYRIHPALLDTCFHSLYAAPNKRPKLSLPFAVDALEIRELPDPSEELWCQGHITQSDTGSIADLTVFNSRGTCVLRAQGLQGKLLQAEAGRPTRAESWLYETRWRQIAPGQEEKVGAGCWLIVGDCDEICAGLAGALDSVGHSSLRCPAGADPAELAAGLQRLMELGSCRGIIHLAGWEAAGDAPLTGELMAQVTRRTCETFLNLLHAAAPLQWQQVPRLFVVTRNAKDLGSAQNSLELAESPLTGLARVASVELREFRVTQVDIDPETPYGVLVQELLRADDESEVALRGSDRYGPRLTRLDPADRATIRSLRLTDGGRESYRLESSGTGVFDGLKLRTLSRQSPGAGEVEIRVAAVGLNFLDVLKGLNLAPGLPAGAEFFGMECSGRIVAVGEGVQGFRLGDEVITMDSTATGCLRGFLTTSASTVFPKPPHLSLEEAATLPVAYQTAYYALCELAHLGAGESVLIHSAAGGVGLAAMEIARQRGAVIFATAGTGEKRAYLKRLGAAYTMDSHTLDFAQEVMEYTGGRGVDVVLNSLAGEAIPRSLSVLATGGRFLEIGKRDIYADSQIGLLPFQRNLSFFAVDLLRLRMEKPEVVDRLTREIVQRIADGTFPPLPYTGFPVSRAADAFRHMAQGKHTGKIVITLPDEAVQVEDLPRPVTVRADATYLITGGLGALGLVFAGRMVEQGARHLVLMGRKGPTTAALEAIGSLRATGAQITVAAADVSDAGQLSRVLAEIRRSGPPLRGVLHAAGITDDKTLRQLRWEHFASVFAPKVLGGWNLHAQLQSDELDFFVLFSSAASVLGGAGQANYAAANAFLDGLAHYRRRAGLPALSVNWGPWADVGMAAQDDMRGGRLAERGLESIPVREGSELLDLLLKQRPAQIAVMPIAWPVWAQHFPEALGIPFLSELASEWTGHLPQTPRMGLRQAVLACESEESALELLHEDLRSNVARILRIPEERLNSKLSLIRLGLDSLMAVEMKNRIDSDFDVRLPATKLLQGPSILDLAEWLRAEIRKPGSVAPGSIRESAPLPDAAVNVDQLSDDEVTAMLDQILGKGGRP